MFGGGFLFWFEMLGFVVIGDFVLVWWFGDIVRCEYCVVGI